MDVKGQKPPMDLTDSVTVFVSTVGDRENYRHCIDALDHQDSRFRFEFVDHVAPMSAAFQQMIDHCETPFYVQVDEDFILAPYAIRILHDAMSKAPQHRAIVCYSLWDKHMEQAILGVKIYRHSIVKQYPYNQAVPHCDVEQLERMQAAGYTVDVCFLGPQKGLHCIGEHGAHYTPETAYEAYFNRAAKLRMYPEWKPSYRQLLPTLWKKVAADPSNLVDLYAYLGFAAGMTTDLSRFNHEKDYRHVNHDFRRLKADMEHSLPTQLSLHVNSQCNMKCSWCPRQAGIVASKPDMKVETLIEALTICPTIKSVCIAGLGEPLLCSNLGDIIQEAKRQNLYVGLITNGVLLADFAKVLNAWRVDSVSVSLNAATAESHKRCNRTDTWDRVIKGIKEAVKIFPLRVKASMVVHRENVGEMKAFLELAASLGVSGVDFLTLLPVDGNNDGFWKRQIGVDQQSEIDALRSHPEAGRVTTWPVVIRFDTCSRVCQSPYVSLSVDSENFVSPCRRVMAPSKKFGKLNAACPPWKTAEWYKLRASLEGDLELPDVCKMCFGCWIG
jgi:MoaA/NifB/PqqE/SkfB family radical SAM enzyme